jgi:hypothetical protein
MHLLLSPDRNVVAVDCHQTGQELIVGLIGISEKTPSTIELIDQDTGDRYQVTLPDDAANQPVYLIGEGLSLTITTTATNS